MRDYETEKREFIKQLGEALEVIGDMEEKENFADLEEGFEEWVDGDFYVGVMVRNRCRKECKMRGIVICNMSPFSQLVLNISLLKMSLNRLKIIGNK